MTKKFGQHEVRISPTRLPLSFADGLFAEGMALHRSGHLDDAENIYKEVIALDPNHFNSLRMLGTIFLQRGDYAAAVHQLDIALKRNRGDVGLGFAETHCNRGVALYELKRYKEALTSYDRALALQPNYAEALSNRGNTLKELKRYEEALASYDRALAIRPDYAEALSNRGNTLREMKRYDEALASYEQALSVRSDFAGVLLNRAVALYDLKRFEEAVLDYDRALAIRPDFSEAQLGRGNTLKEMSQFKEALASYNLAIAGRPDYAEAYTNKGNVLKELGRFDDALRAYIEALRLDPNMTGVYLNLADIVTFTPGDPHLARLETLATNASGLSEIDGIHLDFALGKAYADLGDYPRSFRHLLSGNAAKRATIAYDEKSTFAWLDRIEAVFTRELIETKSGTGNASCAPIFILGMPRSATTLIEQIIASHPMVYGAGELLALHDAVAAFAAANGDGTRIVYPEFVPEINESELSQIGARYIATLRERVPSHVRDRLEAPNGEANGRVTDKMPSNYYFAGLIHLALPNAKILHTIRDPIDTCISCFSKLFSAEQSYSYDLGELGRYYKRYEKLMAHWHRVLPAGCILDVRYEDVVADFEVQVRRIISHCGLPWDDRCLDFHNVDRPVSTASAMQVRQPIYKSAVGRWRVYEQHLDPLLNALDPRLS